MKKHNKHKLVALGLVGLAFVAWGKSLYTNLKYEKKPAPEPTDLEIILDNFSTINTDFEQGVEEATKDIMVQNYPESLNIEMPFYAQAPTGDWGMPYQEACEEASVLLAANLFFQRNWSLAEFDKQIQDIVEWEIEKFGAYEHTDVDQTVIMAEEYLGLKTNVVENPDFADLQKAIVGGRLIIAPFAGKQLGNPHFTNGGPTYHMFLIKGFDAEKNQVVAHEVGTRHGENYVYDWGVIESSLHDWHDENINLGEKRWIEVWAEK